MKKNLRFILLCVSVALGVLALVMLALPGLSHSESGVKTTIGLAGLVFGGATTKIKMKGVSVSMGVDGGMSIFALIGTILVVAAIVLVILKVVMKKDKFELIAGCLFILAAICMMMLKVAGTEATLSSNGIEITNKFKDFVDGMGLGVGAILFSIFSLLASGLSIGSRYIKK